MGIDIDIVITLLRLAATVLTAVALFVWARLGPAPLPVRRPFAVAESADLRPRAAVA